MLDTEKIKQDFPIFQRQINGVPLVYLDNAATSQKPKSVIDGISEYYSNHNANIHRGVHTLGDESTELYESVREKVAGFIGARKAKEIIFTKNSTEALNLVANSWGLTHLKPKDVVLVCAAEHNSDLIPWLEVCKKTGATLEFFSITNTGEMDWHDFKKQMEKKVKIVAVSHASNVLGTIFPIKEICDLAKGKNAVVVVDGSQAIPHLEVNVQSLGCDFYAFSAHKMLGPMGVGVLWGREVFLDTMPPVAFGGGMVLSLNLPDPEWLPSPEKFEAGTPDVAGVVGLGLAIDYINKIGLQNIRQHEIELSTYAIQELGEIRDLKILGPLDPEKRTGLVSFIVKGLHSHDIASVLNSIGVAVRSGMHCAMNLHKKMDIVASTRASYYLYNSKADIDKLVEGIRKADGILK